MNSHYNIHLSWNVKIRSYKKLVVKTRHPDTLCGFKCDYMQTDVSVLTGAHPNLVICISGEL